MKYISYLIAGLYVILLFQNCSSSSSHNGEVIYFSADSIYPYHDKKPQYFENVQLTEAVKINDLWTYQFAASIVYIENPAQMVDVEIRILDEDGNILCPRTSARVNNGNNHIPITNCQREEDVESVRIEVDAKLPAETMYKRLQTYTFQM